MFGLNKIKEAKERAEALKLKMAAQTFAATSLKQEVKVLVSGTKQLVSVEINDSIFKIRERAEVQNLIVEATNKALMLAEEANKAEMKKIMPNIPGLNLDL